jgi:hypothetical protein
VPRVPPSSPLDNVIYRCPDPHGRSNPTPVRTPTYAHWHRARTVLYTVPKYTGKWHYIEPARNMAYYGQGHTSCQRARRRVTPLSDLRGLAGRRRAQLGRVPIDLGSFPTE